MTTATLLFSLALQSHAVPPASIQYYQGTFEVHSHGRVRSIAAHGPDRTPPKIVAFRKDDAYAVWDERGLTIRRGDKSFSTKLPEIVVSPRFFSKEQILQTLGGVRSGQFAEDVDAVSGARRLGKDVYFLLRWDDKDGAPWAEALAQVDLNAQTLHPQILGRFGGLSTAALPVDDKLLILDGKLAIVERTKDTWGLATYDPATQEFKSQAMGASLVSLVPINLTQALFVEISTYGTNIAGRVDLESGTRKILYEGRERLRFIDAATPEIILAATPHKTKLVNCVTGAVRLIPYAVDAKRSDSDILLWTTAAEPTGAWLMTAETWQSLAIWRPDLNGTTTP